MSGSEKTKKAEKSAETGEKSKNWGRAPLQQSKAWQTLVNDLGEESYFKQEKGYQFLAILKTTPVGKYLYLPYGPVAADQESFDAALSELKRLARSKKAFFIRIEPQNRELKLPPQAKKSHDLNPADTWVLDLTPEKAELLTNFSQGTRTRYNTFTKKGIVVEKTHEIEKIKHLVGLQSALAAKKGINTFSKTYLETELKQPFATLYLVKYEAPNALNNSVDASAPEVTQKTGVDNQSIDQKSALTPQPKEPVIPNQSKKPTPENGEIIAASLFFDDETTRYYMQSAANDTYRHLPATVALLTTALFDAKEQGKKYFDFWGIAPENADKSHPWYGFTEFKKSFGGEARHYLGTYDLPLNSARYQLYQGLRRVNRWRRKR